MAHFIKLHQLDVNHDSKEKFVPVLFNLDTIITIEPSCNGNRSRITTRWTNGQGIQVSETLDEILQLSKK